jgi:hypothetical protein
LDTLANNQYWIGSDVDVFGIRDFSPGGTIYFDNAFGFSSSNIGSEYSVSYDSARNKTLIDISTDSFNKDGIVVIDGEYELSSTDYDYLSLTFTTPPQVIEGTEGDDELIGSSGNDVIYG